MRAARARFSSSSSPILLAAGSTLTRALFFTFLARSAKRSVDNDSSRLTLAGDTQASMSVREFPPRLSCSRRVSLLSR